MNKHIALNPCPFCGAGLTLDIDEGGGVAILHSLKTEKNCWFPSIVEVEMPVGTTLEEMTEIINRRPTQESSEHALVGASLVAAARLQDKVFEIQDLKAELARLQAERRWIPVSERLPEVGKWVIVWMPDKYDEVEYTHRMENGEWADEGVTHWMPLPKPPEEDEMSEELRPCPFCGGEAQVNTWTMHGITESRCFCSNSDCPNSVRTVAFEQWNNRPIEGALHARIAELDEFKMIVEGCGFEVITEPPVLNHPERKILKGHGTIYVPELPEPPEVK
jgi:hypothetical protein